MTSRSWAKTAVIHLVTQRACAAGNDGGEFYFGVGEAFLA